MWVLNLGSSFHATSSRELFQNYVLGDLEKAYLGDDLTCDVIGKSEVKFKLAKWVYMESGQHKAHSNLEEESNFY